MAEKHTPEPYAIRTDCDDRVVVLDMNGVLLADCGHCDTPGSGINAARIRLCLECHAALLAALADIETWFAEYCPPSVLTAAATQTVRCTVNRAIAKAEGR